MTGAASSPASSGNVGPGFDCVGLALDLRCRVTAEPGDDWLIRENDTAYVPSQADIVVRAAAAAATGPFHVDIDNAIPRSRGLGSSAAVAAATAGAAIRAMGREPDREDVYGIVAAIEGHGDNAAAAVYGGLMLAGEIVRPLEFAPDLRVIVAVPSYRLKTSDARAALPAELPRQAAARNLARLGFLIEGLRTGDRDALGAAAGDELHEQARAELSPLTGTLMRAATGAGALHACWSGAGPTALAIATDREKAAVTAALVATFDGRGEVWELDVARDGLL